MRNALSVQRFDNEMAGLKEKLLIMASHAESAVRRVVEAFVKRDFDLAERVRAGDESIDRLEVEVDELAIQLLSRGPAADQLRLIAVAPVPARNDKRFKSWNPEEIYPPGRWGELLLRPAQTRKRHHHATRATPGPLPRA